MSSPTPQTCSQYFKAISDETRLKMIGILKDRELCVCDLMEVLELPQSTASRHLSYLKNSGWITGRREGKWMYYKLVEGLLHNHYLMSIVEYISGLPDILMLQNKLNKRFEQKSNEGRCSK